MEQDGSVTKWIGNLRRGQPEAARELLDRFFTRMKQLARPRSQPHVTGGAYDEEDVALSAFASFCRAMQAGKYDAVADRNDLWQLLATFTLRKAHERARFESADKRGGEAQRQQADGSEADLLDRIAGRTPPPDLLALMSEECRRLLDKLGDEELESVAVWKLEGYTNDEIAAKLGYTRRTVQRMLALIRQHWEAA